MRHPGAPAREPTGRACTRWRRMSARWQNIGRGERWLGVGGRPRARERWPSLRAR
ncbi:hypothetical protein B0H19DRAFT_1137897 [Mycena capillaripes]|nr:hypothetical protein B0H19DRAFT_1137897 [Mycena capillaripes]